MFKIRTRFDNLPKKKRAQVEEEMRRQPDESKMTFIKRTIARCYRKRIAKSELSLLRIGCSIRPSNAMKQVPGSKLLFTKDHEIGVKTKEIEEDEVESEVPDLVDKIGNDSFYKGRE